jgi:peroxiredoxin
VSCVAELVELGRHAAQLRANGLRVVCVSTDSAAEVARAQRKLALPFSFVADDAETILDALDLRHAGAGPKGKDAFYATTFVLGPERRVVFRHAATDVRDRMSPAALIEEAVRRLGVTGGSSAASPGDRRP